MIIKIEFTKLNCCFPCPFLQVVVNHVPIKIGLSRVYFYDIEPAFPDRKLSVVKKSDKPIFVRAFEEFKRKNANIIQRPYGVAYDGQKIAYSTAKLPFNGTHTKIAFDSIELEKSASHSLEFSFFCQASLRASSISLSIRTLRTPRG